MYSIPGVKMSGTVLSENDTVLSGLLEIPLTELSFCGGVLNTSVKSVPRSISVP